jgi:glycosyltransferase involved in cell wall biosynthesis
VPVWNPRADWLIAAVRSVLAQRGCQKELIVVDDGCPSPVEALLQGIDDKRLRVLRVEHGGASPARNAGVAAAVGDWFRFADADDVLELNSTNRLLRLVNGADDLIGYGATMWCDPDLRPLWTMASRVQGSALTACVLRRFPVRPFSAVFPRSVVEATGDWDPELRLSHDWDYLLRALEHATVRGETAIATYYRKHPSSLTNLAAAEEGRVVEKYFERHREQRGTQLERRVQARLEATLARAYIAKGLAKDAFAAALRSLRLDPSALLEEGWQSSPRVVGRIRNTVRPREPVVAKPSSLGASSARNGDDRA